MIFFLLIFFISAQLGLHFWPSFSYVTGIRIDYLSPTLHLIDILVVILIVLSLFRVRSIPKIKLGKKYMVLLALFMASIIWNVFNAKSFEVHLFGIVKIIEFICVGLYIWLNFKKNDIKPFVYVLSASAVLSSLLAIWQFIIQSSVGGAWYYFGERTFSLTTIGIAKFSIETEILRPYASFPHPNVLAFFLLMSLVFMLQYLRREKNIKVRFLLSAVVFISSIALFVTFSRVAIILYCIFLLFEYFRFKKYIYILPLILLAGLYFANYFQRFVALESVARDLGFRIELLGQSFLVFKDYILFGVGFNNFFIHQAPLARVISPTLYQPPHNIFILALIQLGILGFLIFPAIILGSIRSVTARLKTKDIIIRRFYRSIFFVLISVVVVGMFDHFFLTLEQGQLMLAVILGLSFSKIKA